MLSHSDTTDRRAAVHRIMALGPILLVASLLTGGLWAEPGPVTRAVFRANVKPALIMRDSPFLKGRVVAYVPFGERIERRGEAGPRAKILGLDGYWLPVAWQGRTGWVYGPLLGAPDADFHLVVAGGVARRVSGNAFLPVLIMVVGLCLLAAGGWSLLRRYRRENPARRRYVKGQDVDRLAAALERAMNEERLYRGEGLNLNELAARVGTGSHELSEYLNERLGKNFNGYVNEFRVKEAMDRLKAEPEESILAIAIDVGFGSKATFNRVFKKITGRSPGEFRKAN